ncbi:hypothetical protein RvY_02777-2 [Ramazzottius varieornatus]|uniref:Protein kinase domain-containing protein n=1 Tax=Ramazzottius varieornatus TaxID=947166 RepID=A0A1D1UPB0_RAMVA|nr:hypothetical protein RvY_02777-2 [Ramazzottius varieornatus]
MRSNAPRPRRITFDHDERIIICKPDTSASGNTCSFEENRATFTQPIHTDPLDDNWIPYMRECRERFAFRLFYALPSNPKTPYVINQSFKILSKLPSITHYEQYLAWNDVNKKTLTLRIASKREISNKFRTKELLDEKHLMFCCEYPFTIDFIAHFQTPHLLCMLVEQLPGGHLQDLVEKSGKVPFKYAQFYGGQIVLALEYLHNMSVILRDLRLDSIVICEDGYVKLTDLGNAISTSSADKLTTWFEDYRAGVTKMVPRLGFRPPEVWKGQAYNSAVDWWSFGLVLYKIYSGNDCFPEEPPSQFYEEQMKRKIFDLHYDTPRWFTAADRKIFKELLTLDPNERLGTVGDGVYSIKTHAWFKGNS